MLKKYRFQEVALIKMTADDDREALFNIHLPETLMPAVTRARIALLVRCVTIIWLSIITILLYRAVVLKLFWFAARQPAS
jgi:hypothetical protein